MNFKKIGSRILLLILCTSYAITKPMALEESASKRIMVDSLKQTALEKAFNTHVLPRLLEMTGSNIDQKAKEIDQALTSLFLVNSELGRQMMVLAGKAGYHSLQYASQTLTHNGVEITPDVIKCSEDGKLLATVINNSQVLIWQHPSNKKKKGPRVFTRSGIYQKPNENAIGLAEIQKPSLAEIQKFSNDWQCIHSFHEPHNLTINCVIFSPDSKLLATRSEEGIINIWDIENKQHMQTIDGHLFNVDIVPLCAFKFSPNNEFLVSGSEDKICFWKQNSDLVWECVQNFTTNKKVGKITGISFAPKTQLLAVASENERNQNFITIFKQHNGIWEIKKILPIETTYAIFVSPNKVLCYSDEGDGMLYTLNNDLLTLEGRKLIKSDGEIIDYSFDKNLYIMNDNDSIVIRQFTRGEKIFSGKEPFFSFFGISDIYLPTASFIPHSHSFINGNKIYELSVPAEYVYCYIAVLNALTQLNELEKVHITLSHLLASITFGRLPAKMKTALRTKVTKKINSTIKELEKQTFTHKAKKVAKELKRESLIGAFGFACGTSATLVTAGGVFVSNISGSDTLGALTAIAGSSILTGLLILDHEIKIRKNIQLMPNFSKKADTLSFFSGGGLGIYVAYKLIAHRL